MVNVNIFPLLLAALLCAANGAPTCETGWIAYKDELCIKAFTNLETYHDAQTHCTNIGNEDSPASLLMVKDAKMQKLLVKITEGFFDNVWLGGRYDTNSSQFVWENGQPLVYSNWMDGFPRNDTVVDEARCIELRPGKYNKDIHVRGKWVPESCLKRNIVICQKPPVWSLQDAVVEIIALLKTQEQELQQVREDLANADSKFTNMSSELATTNSKLASANFEIGSLKTRLATATTGLASASSEIVGLESRLTTTTTGLVSTNFEMTSLKSTLTTATSGLASANSEIASLKSRLTTATNGLASANSEIASLKSRLTTATTGIANANVKITSANSEITSLKSRLTTATTGIASANSEIASLKSRLTTATTGLASANSEIAGLKSRLTTATTKLATVSSTVVPVGSIYVEYHNQRAPRTLWPSFTWQDITSTYAGMFFRALGGDAAGWGTTQNSCAPRVTNMEFKETWATAWFYPFSADLPADGWSSYMETGKYSGPGSVNAFYEGIRLKTAGCEVRPKNQAIRIWKRTA